MRTMSEENNSLNRRTVLKTMGSGIAATGVAGVAAAGEETPGQEYQFVELDARERWNLLSELYYTDAFQQLYEIVLERGERFEGIYRDSRGGRLITDEVTREIVSLELSTTEADDAYLTIGRDRGRGVSVAQLEYNMRADDGVMTEHTVYDPLADGVTTTDAVTAEQSEYGVTRKTVNPEPEIRNVMADVRAELESGDVNGSAPITVQGSACNECKWAVPLICQNACGAAGGFACGFFGIISGGIGGVGCLTIVNVTCGLASLYGCSTGLAEEVCSRVNLC